MIQTKEMNQRILDAPGITGDKLTSFDGFEMVRISIAPGKEIQPHAMPIKVVFYLIAGSGLLSCDGKDYRVEVGSTVECQANLQRGWKNEGEENLEILVVKVLPEVNEA